MKKKKDFIFTLLCIVLIIIIILIVFNIFKIYNSTKSINLLSEYIIKNNELKILETKRMIKLIKKELGFFDYRDYLFEDNLSIYLLVSDLSIFGDDTSIIYRSYPGDCDSTFSGTVIFTKMNEHGYVSLNKDDIDLILKHINKLSNGLFEMRYFNDDTC